MLHVITDVNFMDFLLHWWFSLSALYCVLGKQNPIYFYIDSVTFFGDSWQKNTQRCSCDTIIKLQGQFSSFHKLRVHEFIFVAFLCPSIIIGEKYVLHGCYLFVLSLFPLLLSHSHLLLGRFFPLLLWYFQGSALFTRTCHRQEGYDSIQFYLYCDWYN